MRGLDQSTKDSVEATSQILRQGAALVRESEAQAATRRTGAIELKLANNRQTTARNRAYRDSIDTTGLSNRPSRVLPTFPPVSKRSEVPTATSIKLWGLERATAAEDKEIHKIFVKYDSLRIIDASEVEPGAIFCRSMSLHKLKSSSDTVSARFVIDGGSQPPDSYGTTYSTTADQANRSFVLSSSITDAANRGVIEELIIADCDVPGAFLHNRLTRDMTGGHQIVTRLPHDLIDKRYAGKLCEVTGCQYGMKQSNAVFAADLRKTLVAGGYAALPSDDCIFIKWSKSNPLNKSVVSTHVDDFSIIVNHDDDDLYNDFVSIIRTRYGADVPFNKVSEGICGVHLIRNSDNTVQLNVSKYILKMLTKYGFDDVDAAITPSLEQLFFVDPESPALSEPRAKMFRRVNGSLIWPAAIRFDIHKEVSFLCSRNVRPTEQDLDKQVHLLRYLKGCPNLGPVYSSAPSSDGSITVVAEGDAAHAVHMDGTDQLSYTIRVGDNNAAFCVYAGASNHVVSPNPMNAEYVIMNKAAQRLIHFRQLASDLGYDQSKPSPIGSDSQSSINLAVAPAVTRKCRNIFVQHHSIRSLVAHKIVTPVKINTNDIGPDMHTKTIIPINSFLNSFLYGRARVFNTLSPRDAVRILK